MATAEEMLQILSQEQQSQGKSILSIEQMLKELESPTVAASETPAEPEGQSILDWFKGGKRDPQIDLIQNTRLGLPADKAAKMTALLATTASDDRLQSGIKEILPNATFDKDEYGNLVVISPVFRDGKETQQFARFYPNPKGLNAVDLMQGAGAIALGQAIAMTGGLLGVPTAGIFGGGLIGMTEAAIVEAASSNLSNDPFQVFDIPIGFMGGAGGAKISQILGDIIAKVKSKPSAVLDSDGNLKPAVRTQLTELGLDPDNITAELAAKIRQQVASVGQPQAAASLAEAESLPTPIPLTRGEASGSKAQQLFEDQVESGMFGDPAMLTMKARRAQQQAAIEENLGQIKSGMGGEEVTQSGAGGIAAQKALAAQRAAEKRVASQMFTDADQAGYAFVSPNLAGAVADDLRGVLRTFNPSEVSVTASVVDEMEDILARGGDVKQLFQLRQRLVNTGAGGTPEQTAASRVRRQLDNSLEALIDQQLLTGDPEAVTKQLAAIKNYSDFASKWKSDGVLSKLTDVVGRDGQRVFKQAPEGVANFLFGANGSKLVGAPQMARDLITLKRTLPSEQWNQLRQEAFLLMANRAQKSGDDGIEISGTKFQTFWNTMKNQNPALVKGLFTPDEIRTISQFASVSARVTGGAKNYSNSTTAAGGLIQKIAGFLGDTTVAKLAIRAPIIKGITQAVAGAKADEAFKIPLGKATQPLSGAAGAGLAGETGGDPLYDLYQGITGVRIPR